MKNVLDAKIDNLSEFKKNIEVISKIVDEVQIDITEEGFSFKAMDPAHVILVKFNMLKDSFESYRGFESKIKIDLSDLSVRLKRFKEELTLRVKEEEHILYLIGENKTITQSLLDISSSDKEVTEPELDFAGSFKLKSKLVEEAIKDISVVSDYVNFHLYPKSLKIKSTQGEPSVKVEISDIEIEFEKEVTSTYSLELLKSICKTPGEEVKVKYGKDIPAMFEYEQKAIQTSYMLAPRVESD